MIRKNIMLSIVSFVLAGIFSISVSAQVTTGDIAGRVIDGDGNPIVGATIEATHEPSGTLYTSVTNDAGRYALPGLRIGGPYSVRAYQAGFNEQKVDKVQVGLGTTATLNFTLSSAITATVDVSMEDSEIFSESSTGASTSIGLNQVENLPTISRRINDFTRLTPQAGGGGTFAGQDNRLNNITVDGSYFNNSFGLGGQPGERTGVSPISLDAIEAIQVNISPYDVRQGNFVGAGVNTVTRSGTNTYNGSVYYMWRKPGLVGKKAGDNTYNPGDFNYKNWGFRLGGPLPFFNFGENDGPMFVSGKNKLFFFTSYEDENLTQPGTTYLARQAGQTVGGNITRVLASDLDGLSSYLANNFGYQTGPYQGYSQSTPAKKFLLRADYNINTSNRLSLRYMMLDSSTDVLESNSSSLGYGSRRTNLNSLNFENSNYKILENIKSFVGEWNSSFGAAASNSLIVGYTKNNESRGYMGEYFPLVDILEGGSTYTSFGFEPFTPNNELRYDSFQIQDNLTFYRGSHTISTGVSYEKYKSENVFFPGSQSVYVYNSLADFYKDANGYLANPNRTTSPVSLRRFQVRWSNIPGLDKPLQPLKVQYVGFYGQDNWKVKDNFSLTYGLRIDVPFFEATGFTNPAANALTFMDENGQAVQYETQKLPDANILWSPRVGFNWNPLESGRLQVRGGTGIFTGRPAYVWISNQIGNNGILTGFEQFDNTTLRPWNPNPNAYKPTTVNGSPASSYELALTDKNFKFPQLWRSSVAADVKLPWGMIGTAEYMYSRDVNGIYYINANLSAPNSSFTGVDTRPRWTGSNRINGNISSAIVLKNQNVGKMWDMAFSLEKPYSNGLWIKGGYNFGESKNTVDPGSIASGSWFNNPMVDDPNNPGLGYASATPGQRVFASASYRLEYFNFGATTFSTFWETRKNSNSSYRFSGDMNGDGGTSNDLIYIPRDQSEMNFEAFTSSGTTFTAAQQAAAWDAFISQDPYLSKHRGEYAERGAAFLPFYSNIDFSIAQDIFFKWGSTKHTFQIRADVLNFGNMLSHKWGVGQTFVSTQPLIARGADSNGAAIYRLRNYGSSLISNSFTPTSGPSDVYTVQLGIRYIFN
ncbi:MAG: carboxypeptidase regulatory-like domain-containing protein [Pyrinomonadaceae bacterium]